MQRVDLGTDSAGFERVDPGGRHHHHLRLRALRRGRAVHRRAPRGGDRVDQPGLRVRGLRPRGRPPRRVPRVRRGLRRRPAMSWIAIPLAGLTVLATLAGGCVALRLRHSLPTVIALTGGVVVAVALFDVLPEGIDLIDDPNRATTLVAVGLPRLLLRRAGADPPPPRRSLRGQGPQPRRGPRRARALDPQLHRRSRDRARLRPRRDHRAARLRRRDQPRLRRRAEHGQLRPQPVGRPAPGPPLAADRRRRPAARRGRRHPGQRLRRDPRLHPLPLLGLLPLHGGDRPAARGPRARLLGQGRAHRLGLRRDLRGRPGSPASERAGAGAPTLTPTRSSPAASRRCRARRG